MEKTKSANRGWVTSAVKLTGKTVLITGANSGIGLETATDLAERDARVIIACRNLEKAATARNQIIEESGNDKVIVKELDLASFDSIRNFARDFIENESRLDILINNAGLLVNSYRDTKDGFEMHFGVNHLGPFLLTNLLLDMIKRSDQGRIITVSSIAHANAPLDLEDPNMKKNFNGLAAYAQSKLMNLLFSRELAKQLSGTNVTSNSLHPGGVQTGIFREAQGLCDFGGCIGCLLSCFVKMKCCLVTPEKGAQTSIFCAVAPELKEVTGKYFSDCKVKNEARRARNDEDAKRLWDLSAELTGLQTSI